jgi:hypothetical protein
MRILEHFTEEHDDDTISPDMVEKVAASLAAVAAAFVARQLVFGIWRLFDSEGAPKNPADRETGWREALLFGGFLGLVVGMLRISARRGTSEALERWRS